MFNRLILAILLVLCLAFGISARGKLQGVASKSGVILTSGTSSTTKALTTFPNCTVTVYLAGTLTLASIYADNSGTVKSNPFTAGSDASWFFYADDGHFDVRFSGTGIASPFTVGDLVLLSSTTPSGTAGGDLDGIYPNPTISTSAATSANTPSTIVKRDAGSAINVTTVNTSTVVASSTISTTGVVVNSNQVLGSQQAAVENADGTLASVNAQLNLLLAAMRNHGLIATTITPSSVAGLLGWWKADSLVLTDGDPVTTWTDSASLRNATQASAGNKPIYKAAQVNGKPAVRFDGTDDWLDFTRATTVRTVFFVAKHSLATPNFNTTVPGLTIGDASDTSWAGDSGIQQTSYVTGANVLNGTAYEGGVSIPVASVAKSAQQFQVFTYVTTGNSAAQYIGLDRSQFLQADIAEVILYSGVLSSTNRQGIENYLKSKYATSLPKAIIFDGNSLTTDRYYESQVLPSQVWTNQIQSLLSSGGFGVYDAFNFAHNGQNQTQMNAARAALIDPLCAMGRAKCIVPNWEATNQLSTGTSGHDTYLLNYTYGTALKSAGAQVVTLTAIKRGDWAAPYEVQRQAYNTELLANCATVATVCVNLDVADFYDNVTGALGSDGTPDFNDPTNTLFYRPDTLHITALGNLVVARAVSAAILALP